MPANAGETEARPRCRFDRAAPAYGVHAGPQARVAQRLDRLLDRLTPARPPAIWEVGCGSGLFTRLLVRRFPSATIRAGDRSAAMLAEAARQVAQGAVEFREEDAFLSRPERPVDLLCSSSALHWLGLPGRVASHLAAALAPGGHLAAAIMVAGTLREPRQAARAAGCADGFPDLPPAETWSRAFSQHLRLLHAESEDIVEETDSPRSALRLIRGQGVNQPPFAPDQPLSASALRRLCRAWPARAGSSPPRYTLTYRVLYVLARRD